MLCTSHMISEIPTSILKNIPLGAAARSRWRTRRTSCMSTTGSRPQPRHLKVGSRKSQQTLMAVATSPRSTPPAAPPAEIGDHARQSKEEDEKQNNRNRSEPSRVTFQLRLGAASRFFLGKTTVTRGELARVVHVHRCRRRIARDDKEVESQSNL